VFSEVCQNFIGVSIRFTVYGITLSQGLGRAGGLTVKKRNKKFAEYLQNFCSVIAQNQDKIQ
jgi:hypothetical protein